MYISYLDLLSSSRLVYDMGLTYTYSPPLGTVWS